MESYDEHLERAMDETPEIEGSADRFEVLVVALHVRPECRRRIKIFQTLSRSASPGGRKPVFPSATTKRDVTVSQYCVTRDSLRLRSGLEE
jgi:hypothetical protein